MWSGSEDVLVTPKQLYDLVWSKPMRDIAAEVGMSDVGLAKFFRSRGIVVPPRGWWAKKAVGKAPRPPQPPPRGLISVSGELANYFRANQAHDPPPEGPFASPLVPEDLEELRSQLLKKIGKVTVPRLETRTHGVIAAILKKDAKIAAEAGGKYSFLARRPVYDAPFERRRLRVLNELLLALQEQGYSASLRGHEELELYLHVADYTFSVTVDVAKGKVDRSRWLQPEARPPASAPLVLQIRGPFSTGPEWRDEKDLPLERQIGNIVAGIVVLAEQSYRLGIAHRREAEERQRKWAEERRREEEARREQARITALDESASLLRRAGEVRALVSAVMEAASSSIYELDVAALEEWKTWALGYANRLDPILSGQVLKHLQRP